MIRGSFAGTSDFNQRRYPGRFHAARQILNIARIKRPMLGIDQNIVEAGIAEQLGQCRRILRHKDPMYRSTRRQLTFHLVWSHRSTSSISFLVYG